MALRHPIIHFRSIQDNDLIKWRNRKRIWKRRLVDQIVLQVELQEVI